MRFLLLPALLCAGALGQLGAAPSAAQACGPRGWHAGSGGYIYGWYAPSGYVYYYPVPASSERRSYYDASDGEERRAYYPPSASRVLSSSRGSYSYSPPSAYSSSGRSDIFDRWKPDPSDPFYGPPQD
jgi:hypothetical protein